MDYIEFETKKNIEILKEIKIEKPSEADIMSFTANMIANLHRLIQMSENIEFKLIMRHGIIDLARHIKKFKKAQEEN